MQHSWPFPKIEQNITFRVKRELSAPGRILVSQGQTVNASTVIAEISRPTHFAVVNVAQALDAPGINAQDVLLKQPGDHVEAGEVIAERRGRLPFFKKVCKSATEGALVAVVDDYALIETDTPHEQLPALIDGRVVEIDYGYSVTIESQGTRIEAACGLGGERYGQLKLFSDDPQAVIDGEAFAVLDRHIIFVAGGSITAEAVRHAEAMGLGGVIVGSIDAALLDMMPPPAIPIIATEGFGSRPMSVEVFALLKAAAGQPVSVQAGRWVARPSNIGQAVVVLPSSENLAS